MARPTLFVLNPFELNAYPIICLDKCNGSCNVVDE